MRNQIDNWLASDWVVLGIHVQHRLVALAAIALVALLVAWFERPKRAPGRPSPRLHGTNHDAESERPARSPLSGFTPRRAA